MDYTESDEIVIVLVVGHFQFAVSARVAYRSDATVLLHR